VDSIYMQYLKFSDINISGKVLPPTLTTGTEGSTYRYETGKSTGGKRKSKRAKGGTKKNKRSKRRTSRR
jgi:hypothetical protein